MEGADSVEAIADLLARLDGRTFADGLPAETEVGSRWERSSRLALIRGLGLFKPKRQKQLPSLIGTLPSMIVAVQTATDKTLLMWDELLSQVSVPNEIRQYANGVKKATPQKTTATAKKAVTKKNRSAAAKFAA